MNEAPRFFKFIRHFMLTLEEYTQLLATYNAWHIGNQSNNDNNDTEYENIACKWLSQDIPEDGVEGKVFEKKLENIPLKEKHELYIGGIFPIMGRRYRAPELAQGKQWLRLQWNTFVELINEAKMPLKFLNSCFFAYSFMKIFL